MRLNFFIPLFFTVILCQAQTEVYDLRCEYKKDPIGIENDEPRLSWKIKSSEQDITQTAYELRFANSEGELTEAWASAGKVNSSQSINIPFRGEFNNTDRKYWQVRIWDNKGNQSKWSPIAYFEKGYSGTMDWSASWISMKDEDAIKGSRPSIYLRKQVDINKPVERARIYVSAMGLYELYLNGEKVGDQLFTPGWTSYKNRIQYQVYDVTNQLKSQNVIGGILGDGWYRGYIGWQDQNNYYGSRRALIAQLVVDYTDGTTAYFETDDTWKTSTGPIVKSDIYNGEIFDAYKIQDGWAEVDFNDQQWSIAETLDSSKQVLIASEGPPVKAIEELTPIAVFKTPENEMVVDMGQNLVGWVRIKANGKAGDTLKLKFAEVLDSDGNFYTDNLRSAEATDYYIFNGDGEEVYEPTFTFHGFRYVQLIGLSSLPDPEQVTAVVIHSEMEPALEFSCSNPMLNQLQSNIKWGQKGNFLDVPTDCPQRDERLGWTGDAQVFAKTAAYNYDVASFYKKWMKDLAADQLENGKVPHVIPDALKGNGGATGWADAAIIIPWTVYLMYDDKQILEDQYESMKTWVEYMRQKAGEDHIWTGDFHFGDWLAYATTRSDYPGATTEKDLIATAYYRYSSHLISKIAGILGNAEDQKEYSALSENIRKAFEKEFITPNGRLVSHTQTAYALALAFDLVPEDLIESTSKYFADDVAKFKHLTTGFLGTPLLCKTLCDVGREDLAFMLLNRKEYPSWLYPITQGATTIWERWDGQKPDGSFQSVGMNSFNHYAYGAIGEWLYEYVAGLRADEQNPGFKHFFLNPHPGGDLEHVDLKYESIYGPIESNWKIESGNAKYKVVVPGNTTATVMIPENGKALTNGLSGKKVGSEMHFEIGSGFYEFQWALDPVN